MTVTQQSICFHSGQIEADLRCPDAAPHVGAGRLRKRLFPLRTRGFTDPAPGYIVGGAWAGERRHKQCWELGRKCSEACREDLTRRPHRRRQFIRLDG